jgi:2-methylisocitrate lyase-like PEP mutase family enzyme
VCEAIAKPVNVLARPNLSFDEMTGAGAQRISVGGALTWVATAGLVSAAERIRDTGDFSALAEGVKIDEWL